jgi:GT2 family glycosyltransferase
MNQRLQGVSVIAPTLNRGAYLLNTLKDLLAQEHRPLEILVVDQSRDEDAKLLQLVQSYPDVISYHKVDFRGLPLARNYGWQNARHEAIMFVDDDIRCGSTLVGEHLRALSQLEVGMVAGAVEESISYENDGTPGRFNFWTATPTRSFATGNECFVNHVAGCNFSAWRRVLREAGGFDEVLAIGAALYEETELCLRVQSLGYKIYFNPAARMQHLAAGNGGCRVPDLSKYIASLAHNRAIVIGRHLRWFQRPVAYLRLLLLVGSYALHYRTIGVFRSALSGLLNGAQAAKRSPICSSNRAEVQA